MKILKIIVSTFLAISFFASCSKEYSLEGGNINLPGGTWKFEQGTVPYNGNIDSSFIQGSGVTKTLTIVGKSITGEQNFLITLIATDSFTIGSYEASAHATTFKYSTTAKTIFEGDFLTGEFTVEITSLSNNTITGTFSGKAIDSTGSPTDITSGSFISTINLSNNGTGQGSDLSIGTLGGASSTCSPATLAGVFTQGIALAASNTVQLQVNVSKAGTYTIATNSVNGVRFIKTGIFASTGVQNVILNGDGVPQAAGAQNFTVTYGTSNCVFPVTFLPGTLPTGDYFPTTINSSWVYGLPGGSSTDSIANTVINFLPVIAGQGYSAITEKIYPLSGTADDSLYFRKADGLYYEYEDVSSAFNFDNPVPGEVIFLKDNVPAGTTWQSQDFAGTIAGAAFTGYFKYTLLEKAVPITIGTHNFADVIKVKSESFLTVDPATPLLSTEIWFARGVGEIHYTASQGINTITLDIGQYQVF